MPIRDLVSRDPEEPFRNGFGRRGFGGERIAKDGLHDVLGVIPRHAPRDDGREPPMNDRARQDLVKRAHTSYVVSDPGIVTGLATGSRNSTVGAGSSHISRSREQANE